MAQWNQLAGFLGRLNAGDARNAQHVALLGGAGLDDRQRGGQHLDAAGGDRYPAGRGLAANVDHVGLALCIEVCQRTHGAKQRQKRTIYALFMFF